MCAFVNGTSPDKGLTVKATRVTLSPETNGTCTQGFRAPAADIRFTAWRLLPICVRDSSGSCRTSPA